MKSIRAIIFIAVYFLCAASPLCAAQSKTAAEIHDLRCNNMENPLGVEKVLLSWKIYPTRQGLSQSAWQVQIADSETELARGVVLWDSGKVNGGQMFDVRPDCSLFKSSGTYWWRVRIWDEVGVQSGWSPAASFSMGLLNESDWTAQWISWQDTDRSGLPYLRKVFDTKGKKVTKALAYVCGLGNSDFFVNGVMADSSRVLDPAQTNYEQYALYSTYDISPLLNEGENCIGVMLSNGWFNQDMVFTSIGVYGKPMLKLQVNLTYEDGTQEKWLSDTSWLWHHGPLVSANIYRGEIYDARMSIPDWCSPSSTEEGWRPVIAATENTSPSLRSQLIPPIRMQDTIPAESITRIASGRWIYDFGANSTGNIRLKVSLPKGTVVTVTMSEEMFPDGALDYRSTGTSVTPVQTETYICSGDGEEIWMPRNAYHGFRYAELSCSDPSANAQTSWLEKITCHTELEQTGRFECDNEQLNRLHELAVRTFTSNMQGVPIDCPHREKCGWLGDVHAYLKMCLLNYNADNFLLKYMEDIRSGGALVEENTLHHLHANKIFYHTRKEAGIPYMIAPGLRRCGVASPDWGTALVQIPWSLYLYYGDTGALEEYYDYMKQWTDYISSLAIDNIVYQGLGDWCPMRGAAKSNNTPVEFSSSAFHYLDLCIMSKSAKVLGKKKDEKHYAELAEKVKEAIQTKFYHPLLHTFGTQTADAMALDIGLCPEGEEKSVAAHLMYQIGRTDNFFRVGIFGLSRIGSALSRNGHSKEAFELFTKKGPNSFAWMWEKAGATSLWETLPVNDESIEAGKKASHSHPMQGGYDSWFYEDLAGIRPWENEPGFKTVLLQPCFDVDLNHVCGEVNSRYGLICSEWSKNGSKINWNVEIPVGSTGLIAVRKGTTLTIDGAAPVPSAPQQEAAETDWYTISSGPHSISLCL